MKMNKKAAMELTMGTMVTIVLLVMVLILGGYFVQKIFFSASGSLDAIDESVKGEINKLFSEDTNKKIIIYPPSRTTSFKKGDGGIGFALSMRNTGTEAATFTYSVAAIETDCPSSLTVTQADGFLGLGKTGSVQIGPGDVMADPTPITFNIPETAPPCSVKYGITMQKDGQAYGSSVDVILTVESN
jgi:hypothetical protein